MMQRDCLLFQSLTSYTKYIFQVALCTLPLAYFLTFLLNRSPLLVWVPLDSAMASQSGKFKGMLKLPKSVRLTVSALVKHSPLLVLEKQKLMQDSNYFICYEVICVILPETVGTLQPLAS